MWGRRRIGGETGLQLQKQRVAFLHDFNALRNELLDEPRVREKSSQHKETMTMRS